MRNQENKTEIEMNERGRSEGQIKKKKSFTIEIPEIRKERRTTIRG